MSDKKIVKEHWQKHSITEMEHIPDHDERVETAEFRSAKAELEKVEHIPCYICGSMKNRESHHIFERCWGNAYDYTEVAHMLYNHFDFHGHCRRDFKSAEELLKFFTDHYNGKVEEVDVQVFDHFDEHENAVYKTVKRQVVTCDDDALDTIYNQLIIDKAHHRDEGHSAHGATFATFVAWMAHRPDYVLSMSPKEYEALHPHQNKTAG